MRKEQDDGPRVLIAARNGKLRSLKTQVIVAGVAGGKITSTDDGDEALKLIAEHRIEILIVDCQLPRHALGLASFCRTLDWPKIPVIALCFDGDDMMCRIEASNAKCLAFLSKPSIHGQLPDAVRATLSYLRDGLHLERFAS